MDGSESLSNNDLRQRIADLEEDLRIAHNAKADAEMQAHKKAHHAHHAAANLKTFGHTDTVIFVEPDEHKQGLICELSQSSRFVAPLCRFMVRYNIDQFLQRPVLRQWLSQGKIYREAFERQSSRFELFFDLLFVGIVHEIAQAAADQPSGIGLAKYILTFCPAFSIWADVRDTANQFANDDVTQRGYILWIMILLVGYSNNASAIEWGASVNGSVANAESIDAESTTAVRWTLGFFVIAKLSKVILNLLYGIFLPLSRKPLFINSANTAIGTILFFIAIFTPLHGTIILTALGIVLDYALRVLAIMVFKTLEILGRKRERVKQKAGEHTKGTDLPGEVRYDDDDESGSGNISRSRTLDSSMTTLNETAPLGGIRQCKTAVTKNWRIPAINIEHHVERLGAFVTIVLGEMVVNVLYKSTSATGLNTESGRAILGLMIAFNLNWLYFGQTCRHFVHALRRHWVTSFLFTTLHVPLCMSLLLASSAMNRLVISPTTESESGGGLKWFFGSGLGVSVCTMATIGVLHKNLDHEIPGARANSNIASMLRTRRLFSRRVVLATRYIAGIAMMLVPLAKDLGSMGYLAIYVGITAFLIIEETLARIERREWELDAREEKQGIV